MKVVRATDTLEVRATAPIFVGEVYSRPMIDRETNPDVTVTLVSFKDGGKNRPHTHSRDQMLYITDGQGIVASGSDEHRVSAGDIVHIPAGEVHWHGARTGKDMAHLSILPPCETKVVGD